MTSFQENGMEFNWFIFVYMSSLDKLEHFIFNYFLYSFCQGEYFQIVQENWILIFAWDKCTGRCLVGLLKNNVYHAMVLRQSGISNQRPELFIGSLLFYVFIGKDPMSDPIWIHEHNWKEIIRNRNIPTVKSNYLKPVSNPGAVD